MTQAMKRGLSWLRPVGWGLVVLILLTPLIAMQFTHEVAWTASDFLFATVLLGGAGVLIELAVRKIRNRAGAAMIAGAVVLAVLLIWAQGAVGIV